MRMVSIAVVTSLLSCNALAQEAGAEAKSSKTTAIRRLLQATGGASMGLQVIDNLMGTFKRAYPTVPDEFWTELRSQMKADDLIEITVPVYDKHLTEEEVRGILAFYETPLGRRLVQVQPLIMQDSMRLGQEWGRGMAEKAIRKLKEKGYPGATTGDLRRELPAHDDRPVL